MRKSDSQGKRNNLNINCGDFALILLSQMPRYPKMQIQDVYKLIHQAAMGSEHAIRDPQEAESWLERELQEMRTSIPEPLIDPISPDGKIIRVHLRPYVDSGRDTKNLLNAFIRTSTDFCGNIKNLEEYWDCAVQTKIFPTRTMNKFIQTMKSNDYPAIHHSAGYKQLYHPAYRVIWGKFLPYDY